MGIESLLLTTLRMSIPLVIAAMGGIFATRSGMMAMGLESMMLFGAFGAVWCSYLTGNVFLGFLTGVLFGMVFGLTYAVLTIRFRVNQVIGGIALNLFTVACTTVLMQFVWGNAGNSPAVNSLEGSVNIGILAEIPVIGPVLSGMSINFYIAILLIAATTFVMFHTCFGLRLRMIGENPTAASTLGIKVRGYKYLAMLICGALAGFAGAYLSIDQLNMFSKDMIAGKGYIVVVMLALGKYNPVGAALAALLFGFSDALQINLQQMFSVPAQLVQMLPYIVTILVITFAVRHVKGPAGTGKLPEE